MPFNGQQIYSKPAGTTAAPNTTIESAKFNEVIDDLVNAINYQRPGYLVGFGEAVWKATKALLDADLAHADDMAGVVYADSTAANNGVYVKSGASGAGSWTRKTDLPYSFIPCVDSGAGTANAIQLVANLTHPTIAGTALFLANVFEANGTGGVTVSINGATAKPLLTKTGNALAAGYLAANDRIMFVDDGTDYRLTTDVVSGAIVAAAEAAAAEAAASAASIDMGDVPNLTITDKLVITNSGWDPINDGVFGRSTPETALAALGGFYDAMGAASDNYLWGYQAFMSNPNTAPLTLYDGTAEGWKVRAGGFTGRQFGTDGDAHAVEVLNGQWANKCEATVVSGSPVLTVTEHTRRSSCFCVGDEIFGTGIPSGATIVEISKGTDLATGQRTEDWTPSAAGSGYTAGQVLTLVGGTYTRPAKARVTTTSSGGVSNLIVIDQGDYSVLPSNPVASTSDGAGTGATFTPGWITSGFGYFDTITISANATASGTGVAIESLSKDTLGFAILISGSGDGGSDGTGNPYGVGIGFQSYGDAAFDRAVLFGASALRPDGTGIEFGSVSADFGIHFETTCSFTTAAISVRAGGIIVGRSARDASGTSNLKGITLNDTGLLCVTSDGADAVSLNRINSDGVVQRLRRQASTVGTISVTASATAYNTTSDETFKTFTGELLAEDAIDIIRRDPVRRFVWDENHGGKPAVGWGAQTSHAVSEDLATRGGWTDPITNEPWIEGGVRWVNPLDNTPAKEGDIFWTDPITNEPWTEDGVRWVHPENDRIKAEENQTFRVGVEKARIEPARKITPRAVDAAKVEADYIPWGIDQSKRTPYLWAAMAGMIEKIESLTARVEELEAKIKE